MTLITVNNKMTLVQCTKAFKTLIRQHEQRITYIDRSSTFLFFAYWTHIAFSFSTFFNHSTPFMSVFAFPIYLFVTSKSVLFRHHPLICIIVPFIKYILPIILNTPSYQIIFPNQWSFESIRTIWTSMIVCSTLYLSFPLMPL